MRQKPAPPVPQKRLSRELLLTTVQGAWLAWFVLTLLLLIQVRLHTLHPLLWPFVVLFAVLFLCVLTSVGIGLWRGLRGPRRARSLLLGLLGGLPLALLALPLLYSQRCWQQRYTPHQNLLFKFTKVFAASLMQTQALGSYPHRRHTDRLVMCYRDLPNPKQDLVLMDAHVARLETLLQKPLRTPIYWMRGSLLGVGGASYLGLALGSEQSVEAKTGYSLDRHELAHAVIEQQLPWGADPPTMLSEGWADAQSGLPPSELAQRALDLRQEGRALSLRQLLRPDWYHQDSGPVYEEGAAFVDFLLRRYGPQPFLQLYDECRPETFDADCRRLFGKDLNALEALFWQDVQSVAKPPS
jgi:hypothetical protein